MTGPVLRRVPHLTRTLLGLPALLLGIALLVPTVHAQADAHLGHSAADHVESGTFVLRAGSDGTLVCEHADEAEIEALRGTPGAPPNFTVFTSTNTEQEIAGMRILLRATDQLLEFPGALLAFRRAAARWERAISTPITTVIDVDFGLNRFNGGPFPPNVLASANTAARTFLGIGPDEIVDALLAENGDDPQLQALYSAIPLPTPTTAGTSLQRAVVARPLAQVYGYLPAEANPDPVANPFGEFPTIGFNAAFDWDVNPADGVNPGQFDFEAVAVHEMGHSLGFTSIIGNGGPPNNFFNILDLFRVRPEAVTPGEPLDDGQGWEVAQRVVTPGPPSPDVVQVFFDGNQELPLSTATGGRQGGDGQQASHWRDDALGTPFIGIMDPNFANGTVGDYNNNDLRAMQAIGYRVTYDVPEATATFTVNGEPYDTTAPDSLAFVDIGDTPTSGTADLVFELTNTSSTVALDYSVEVDLAVGYPVGVVPTLTLSSEDGSIAPGSSGAVTLSGGATEQSVFYGVFRIETNVENALVVDVPFRFSVDGGEAPELALSTDEAGYIGDFDDTGSETLPLFTISNEGVLNLDYLTSTTLVTDADPFPFDIDVARTGGNVLFAEDFGNGDLGTFTASGASPGDWQVVAIGPALFGRRAEPNAAYFGQMTDGALQYRNAATGLLVSPALDLSTVSQKDLVALSFDTYLQSAAGMDVASVLVSYDDGVTYQVVATSDNGILESTARWETVRIELPLLASSTESVRFAFHFTSDSSTTDTGWLVDNVMLTKQGSSVFVTPSEGALGEDGTQELSLTVEGDQFDPGYYRGEVTLATNGLSFSDAGNPVGSVEDGVFVPQTTRMVPFALTIGDPGLPILTVATPPIVSVPSDNSEIVELDVSNAGGSQVTYLRLLEPAFSSFEDADDVRAPTPTGLGPADFAAPSRLSPIEPAASVVAGGDSLSSIALPGIVFAITQSTDGTLVAAQVSNSGETYVIAEDLSEIITTLDGFVESGDRAVGLAFNDKSATYWYALASDQLVEAELGSSAVEPTGRAVALDFTPADVVYSPELDAFFVTERSTNLIYAVDEDGTVLPGYPIESPARSDVFPSLSVTNGVIEVPTGDFSFVQVDQFGRLYEESEEITIPESLLGGSDLNRLLRSKVDPDGVFYYSTGPSGGEVLVVAVDPSDLPVYTQTLIEAATPLFGTDLVPDAPSSISLRVDPDGRAPGVYADTLSFLTNNPEERIVRIPLEIQVTPATDAEQGVTPTAFAMHQNYPNPFTARTTLRFDLPTASQATLQVYNVLGQRVATLLDDEMIQAGAHALPLDAQRLASGTYFVRLMAGDFVGTSRITVVK